MSIESLIRDAHEIYDRAGVKMSATKVTRAVRQYAQHPDRPFVDFLAVVADVNASRFSTRNAWGLTDPTGQEASHRATEADPQGDRARRQGRSAA